LGLGIGASLLTRLGAPPDGGISATCFVRDCTAALFPFEGIGDRGIRMTLVGVGLGAFLLAAAKREWHARGGAPLWLSFTLGLLVMLGAGVFVGCPTKLHLRLGGGDPVAVAGLAGLVIGVGLAVLFLRRGYWVGNVGPRPRWQAAVFPLILFTAAAGVLIDPAAFFNAPVGSRAQVLFASPAPGFAPVACALAIGIGVGALAQHTRLCFTTGWSDLLLTRHAALLWVPIGTVAGALVSSAAFGVFDAFPFGGTYWAHREALWAGVGMVAVGMGAGLAQGCPFRQLIRAAQGDRDAAVFVGGLAAGGILWHRIGAVVNLDLIVHARVKVAVVSALVALLAIAWWRSR